MQKQNISYGWVVTFSGTAINLALGALYSWSVFKKPLEMQFGLSDKQSALPYSVAVIIFALMMVPAGRLQDKIGPRIVSTIGGILIGAGFLLASMATPASALAYLVIGFGVLAGTSFALGYASATPPAVKWFPPERKGLIVGLVVSGFGLASVYVAPLTAFILRNAETSRAFLILGVIFAVAVLFFSQFLKNPPPGYKPVTKPEILPEKDTPAKPGKAQSQPATDFSWSQMMSTPQFYLVWIMYAFGAGAGLMVISFLAKHIKSLGSGIEGFIFVAILAVGNAGGRITAGVLSDRIGRTKTMLLVFLLQALTQFIFPGLRNEALLFTGAIIIGFSYGSCLSLFPSITADYYGLKNLGINYGIVFTAWGAGGLVMPIVAGAFFDASGSYTQGFYVAAVLCLAAAAITFIVKPPPSPAKAA